MPRIRTIKPEFWADEKLAPLAAIDRLVFLGLISMADDAGRLVDNVKQIDGFLFLETEESSRDSLDILARLGRITRYTSSSGQKLLQITNWSRHQKVDKPAKHLLPGPTAQDLVNHVIAASSREGSETVATDSRDPRAPTLDLGPTTLDHGSKSTSSSALAREMSPAEVALANRLASDSDRIALDRLLSAVPNAETWIYGMAASLDGTPGHTLVSPIELGIALRDYVANGALQRPNAAQFRAYLNRAKEVKTAGKSPNANGTAPHRGIGARVAARTRAAIEDL